MILNQKNHVSVSMKITIKQQQQRKCYFCGGSIHPGSKNQCPAKDKICNNCGKTGHFKRVCKSILKTTLALVKQKGPKSSENEFLEAEPPHLPSVIAGAPSCLNETILPAKLNGTKVKSLLVTARSFYMQKPSRVWMAFDQLTFVLGKVCTSFSVQGHEYPNAILGIMPGLCCRCRIGQKIFYVCTKKL